VQQEQLRRSWYRFALALVFALVGPVLVLGVGFTRQRYALEIQLFPEQSPAWCESAESPHVLDVASGALHLDGRPIEWIALGQELEALYRDRADRWLQVTFADATPYRDVVNAIGVGRGAGVYVFTLGDPGACAPNAPWDVQI